MSRKASPTIIGAFVVAGIALAVVAVAIIGGGQLLRDTDRVAVYFDESVSGLSVGAPVKLMGINVGQVREITADIPPSDRPRPDSQVAVVLELDEERFAVGGEPVDLGDPDAVADLVDRGLRAKLVTESFVTGLRFIELGFEPEAPPPEPVTRREAELPVIPSVPTEVERIQEEATATLQRLARVEYAETFRSLRKVAESANEVLESKELEQTVSNLQDVTANLAGATRTLGPEGEVGENLAEASEQSAAAATTVRQLLHPDGELLVELETTLEEVRAAARALRRLSEQLSRDPGSLLRGGRQ